MPMLGLHQLANCITCHAWNGARDAVALCPDNNEVHIYRKKGNTFEREVILKEHDQVVTSIDWAPKTNRLVTCSHDRNAYVWSYDSGEWKPTLVILRINRAATHCKWSPDEQKFAVASGAKCVSVCYFEEDNDWWVSKHIKKHKSSVLSVDWHPNSVFLATASSDFKARIFSAFIRGVDTKPANSPFGDDFAFGKVLQEYSNNGWVHSAKWSPSGNQLAFTSHDSVLSIATIGQEPQKLRLDCLPFRDLLWLSEDKLVCAGHDCNPKLFSNKGQWQFEKDVDEAKKAAGAQGSSASRARNMFQNLSTRGEESTSTDLATKHQNNISCLADAGQGAFSTSAVDGKLVLWKL